MNVLSKILVCVIVTLLLAVTARSDDIAGITTLAPESLPKPFKNRFSHGKLIPAGAEWLITAGQTGVNLDGKAGENIEKQADLAMKNLYNIVKEAGMGSSDVIKMTIYYLDPAHLPVIVEARNRYFGQDFRPASTAVGVSALARPEFLLEVEAIAARMRE